MPFDSRGDTLLPQQPTRFCKEQSHSFFPPNGLLRQDHIEQNKEENLKRTALKTGRLPSAATAETTSSLRERNPHKRFLVVSEAAHAGPGPPGQSPCAQQADGEPAARSPRHQAGPSQNFTDGSGRPQAGVGPRASAGHGRRFPPGALPEPPRPPHLPGGGGRERGARPRGSLTAAGQGPGSPPLSTAPAAQGQPARRRPASPPRRCPGSPPPPPRR